MQPDSNFQLELSASELYWLASAFGQLRLPLIENPFAGLPFPRLQAILDDGQASLQQRGLIQRQPGAGWQVERVAAALTRWLAEPENVVVIEVHQKDRTKRRAIAYPREDVALFMEELTPMRFTLHSEARGLLSSIEAFLNIPADSHVPADDLQIVQPEHLLPLVWKSPKPAVSVLEQAGLSHKEAIEVTSRLEKITGSAILTHYESDDVAMRAMNRHVILWGNEGCWIGEISEDGLISIPFYSSKSLNAFLESRLY